MEMLWTMKAIAGLACFRVFIRMITYIVSGELVLQFSQNIHFMDYHHIEII